MGKNMNRLINIALLLVLFNGCWSNEEEKPTLPPDNAFTDSGPTSMPATFDSGISSVTYTDAGEDIQSRHDA